MPSREETETQFGVCGAFATEKACFGEFSYTRPHSHIHVEEITQVSVNNLPKVSLTLNVKDSSRDS